MDVMDYANTADSRSIYIEFFDSNDVFISDATGFFIEQDNKFLFLTCWHACTGYDFINKSSDDKIPEKMKMYIPFVVVHGTKTEYKIIEFMMDLYQENGQPRWYQQQSNITTHNDLTIPDILDVAIFPFNFEGLSEELISRLPNTAMPSEMIFIEQNIGFTTQAFVFGYPYGQGAKLVNKDGNRVLPETVRYTRNIACPCHRSANNVILLDGGLTPTMSGSPVCMLQNNKIYLIGIYSGVWYPSNNKKIHNGSLGIVYRMVDLDPIIQDVYARISINDQVPVRSTKI